MQRKGEDFESRFDGNNNGRDREVSVDNVVRNKLKRVKMYWSILDWNF